MKNLNIATWNLKSSLFELNKTNEKVEKIISFINDQDIDILSLQNVDRALGVKLNKEVKKIERHFDHINEDDYTILDRMIGKEKNPVILKNNFINISDVASVNGLVINKVYITDENKLSEKFMLINAYVSNPDSEDNLDLLAHYINNDEYQLKIENPIILTGGLNMDCNSLEMARLRRNALRNNKMHVAASNIYENNSDYIMANYFDILNSYVDYRYAINEKSKPIVAKVKMK